MANVREQQTLLQRAQRLAELARAYAAALTAWELNRPPGAVVPLLADPPHRPEGRARSRVKDALARGGGGLVADLEELGRLAAQGQDPAVREAVDGVRRLYARAARHNGAALARRLAAMPATDGAAGLEVDSLRRDVQAFVDGVRRLFPGGLEPEEIPPDDRDLEIPTAAAQTATSLLPAARGSLPTPGPELAPRVGAPRGAPGTPAADILEQIEVLGEVLDQWAADRPADPARSALVREGRLSPDRGIALYRDLLEGGGERVIAALAAAEERFEVDPPTLRVLRRHLVDVAAATLPRLIERLAAGRDLAATVDGAPVDHARLLAGLRMYVVRLADLCDAGSSLRHRFLEMASTLWGLPGLDEKW